MIGLEAYVGTKRTIIGIDWLNLASGAMKTAGGAFDGGSGGGSSDAAMQHAMALQAAQNQAAMAQQSASNWEMIGIVGILVVVIGGVVVLKKK